MRLPLTCMQSPQWGGASARVSSTAMGEGHGTCTQSPGFAWCHSRTKDPAEGGWRAEEPPARAVWATAAPQMVPRSTRGTMQGFPTPALGGVCQCQKAIHSWQQLTMHEVKGTSLALQQSVEVGCTGRTEKLTAQNRAVSGEVDAPGALRNALTLLIRPSTPDCGTCAWLSRRPASTSRYSKSTSPLHQALHLLRSCIREA